MDYPLLERGDFLVISETFTIKILVAFQNKTAKD